MRALVTATALAASCLAFHSCSAPSPVSLIPSFSEETIDPEIEIGYGLAIGDVDGDGDKDILLADKSDFVWYRNPDWQRFTMVSGLTVRDNVCIAAEDIDGDGSVEVAVGGQWNPGETSDEAESGSVHFLIRPDDPTTEWATVKLPHEPTVHRMRWVRGSDDAFRLVVLPLHGRGNVSGEGAGVRVLAYTPPSAPKTMPWESVVVDSSMHMTHNMDVVSSASGSTLFVAGKEGVLEISPDGTKTATGAALKSGAGEVRVGADYLATIEPIHGTHLVAYQRGDTQQSTLLDSTLAQGHALAIADMTGQGTESIIAGWRNPNASGRVGIKLFYPEGEAWQTIMIDDNGMAAEDLKAADLDGDGLPEIIAAGRATKNLKIYWNRSDQPR